MSKATLSTKLEASRWEPKFPFDLVVAYEDSETRNRALHLYDHLAQQLLDDYDFQCSWWKFDHLADATLREQAADAAADANMIILCLHARKDLLPVHKLWIESWLPRRDGRKSALVALIGNGEERRADADTMLTYLRRTARLTSMDFFDHAFDLKLPPRPAAVTVTPAAPPPRVSGSPAHDLLYHQMPTPHWGINE